MIAREGRAATPILRPPVAAGRFYPAEEQACRREVLEYLGAAKTRSEPGDRDEGEPKGGRDLILGGLVPHAGWMCSGRVAARVFTRLPDDRPPDNIMLFGGVHRYRGRAAALFPAGSWATPLGPVEVDARFAALLLAADERITADASAHADEHSLEVQLPFLRHRFPGVPIVPLMVSVTPEAVGVGVTVARTLLANGLRSLIVGTTDLTHYGPDYGFLPRGIGDEGLDWAKHNDRSFLERVCAMRAEELVPEAKAQRNACNAGAAAATVAACRELGATRGVLLEHVTSREVLGGAGPNSVGYAAIVFTRT